MVGEVYCTILAGGMGSRLWPLSRIKKPKQFLDLVGVGRTMLQLTYDRFRRICAADHILVVTLDEYRDLVVSQLPELPADNVLCEPFKRNTTASIAYANAYVKQLSQDAVMVVTPADHLILNEESFVHTVSEGVDYVRENPSLMTIGIKAFKPDTSFGYIQVGDVVKGNIHHVRTFTEKPNAEMAQTFYECGDFCWNSGVFVWSISTIDEALRKYMTNLQSLFDTLSALPSSYWVGGALRSIYEQCETISIDYGVLEKATNVVVSLADAVWSDLGGWEALYEQGTKDGNGNAVLDGVAYLKDSSGCLVHVDGGNVWILDGLKNFIVVEREGVTVVCPRERGNSVWRYISEIKAEME